jgi:hypothetical protein
MTIRLSDYDSRSLGPLFAVSDEGSAGQTVVDAAYASAKARALSPIDPLTLGVILDGERMTSAGEVPIGPDEYAALSNAASGRVLCTTNVGVRANVRLLQRLPEFPLPEKPAADRTWLEPVCAAFAPFIQTPDGVPRPLTIRLRIGPGDPLANVKPAVERLEEARSAGRLGPSALHRISLLVTFEDEIASDEHVRRIKDAIRAAADAGLAEVAIDGKPRPAARQRQSVQSLLNVVDVPRARDLLREAAQRRVRLTYPYALDVESMARTIWTGLYAARAEGFAAGKYGLVPMTLPEQRVVIEHVTRWTAGWTAIPAFYVDTPLVTDDDVYDPTRSVEAARLWLTAAREAGVSLVLFDCPDRVDPRRLLREANTPEDAGILTLADVDRILQHARDVAIDILWSGGISASQAFELAKRQVHGIFSTSSTARKIPVSGPFATDPRLPAENEPAEGGIRRIHSIVQGGYLSAALPPADVDLARRIEALTQGVLGASAGATLGTAMQRLDDQLIEGWRRVRTGRPSPASESVRVSVPVAPDAVRVFRGRRRSSVPVDTFRQKLGTLFMPATVQFQRLYGLAAYLPALLPAVKASELPDEIALVFYRTQEAYQFAKRCVGGRAYSELHELVFDMTASVSEFPRLFDGRVEVDRAYHLKADAVDWQQGHARVYVGNRLPGLADAVFTSEAARCATTLQRSPAIDAGILCVSSAWCICWAHGPNPLLPLPEFAGITTPVLDAAAREIAVPQDLSKPYEGFELNAGGDFVNLRFAGL